MERPFGRFPATARAVVSPIARQFLLDVAPQVARALWDEITEIERDPVGRGSLYEDEADPEFAGLRHDLAIAGFAIFYLSYPGGLYVTSVRPWDYPDLAGPIS